MQVEAVIFDIGNVLIEWHPERFYDAEIGRAARERLFAEVDLHAMNDRVDIGGDFRQTIYAAAEANPAHRPEIRMWHDRWLELARPEIPHSVRLLRALRAKGVPVFALTNFGIGSFELARSAYSFLDEFDRRYISGHMRVIKPNPEIYAMVEADCGIAPGALLFADDRADNIAEAQARGWQGHLFDGPQGWADRLIAAGLLNAGEAA
ncbi:HAD family phosphatase [Pseudooceanicola sp.]|uniref:HAD family hydrolase n=1 Tax=Pseudooceanicola sp. TaxID=1914328 RepID=UPI00262B2112|nr:HAD family phosphatase [Pseudooceanicola sp.]MDF1857294.1 HAD family phosphatase [Pseudooceanicola sp.]